MKSINKIKFLIDENVSFKFVKQLRNNFKDHDFDTAQSQGFTGNHHEMKELDPVQKDTKMCELARDNGYDAMIVTDKGFEKQQNVEHLPCNVIFLDTGREHATKENLEKLMPEIKEKLSNIEQYIQNCEKPEFTKISLDNAQKKTLSLRESSAYENAAKDLNAKPIKDGQEIEGEITELAKIDGKNYYVVEAENGRTLVPAGDNPEHEKGDEISAERTANGFEVQRSRDYGI